MVSSIVYAISRKRGNFTAKIHDFTVKIRIIKNKTYKKYDIYCVKTHLEDFALLCIKISIIE